MILLRPRRLEFHAHNSVKRPQNRHLKPFKSRHELNGRLDPRINTGGRPIFFAQTLAKELRRKVKIEIESSNGQKLTVKKTRAEVMAQKLVDIACSTKPHSVGAARLIYDLVEPADKDDQNSIDTGLVHRLISAMICRRLNDVESSSDLL